MHIDLSRYVYDESVPSCVRRVSDGYFGYINSAKHWVLHLQGKEYATAAQLICMLKEGSILEGSVLHLNKDNLDNKHANLLFIKNEYKEANRKLLETRQWDKVFNYESGVLTWNIYHFSGITLNKLCAKPGDIVKTQLRKDYLSCYILDSNISYHKIVFEYFNQEYRGTLYILDHISGDILDNKIENLRDGGKNINARNRNMSISNTSGFTGVCLKSSGMVEATWVELDGKVKTKSFSIKKYGEFKAFQLARDVREKAIKELNDAGAGYTERHGK